MINRKFDGVICVMNGEEYNLESYEDLNELVAFNEATGEYLIGGFIRVDDKGVPLNFIWGTTNNLDEVQWLFYRLSNLLYFIRNSEDLLAKTGEELIDFIGSSMNTMIEMQEDVVQ